MKNITLISICDQEKFEPTVKAMEYSMKDLDFYDSIIVTDKVCSHDKINIISTGKLSLIDYNKFCIYELYKIIKSEFCLLMQWDGFVINPSLWSDDFLNYDYIGAPWDHASSKNKIGNGGFSLRSKKFMEAGSKLKYNPKECEYLYDWQKQFRDTTPEDWFMCYESYEQMLEQGIKFPSVKTAAKFSVEHPIPCHPFNRKDPKTYNSFGFHGHFNQGAMNLL